MHKILIFIFDPHLLEEKIKEQYPDFIVKSWSSRKDCDDYIEEADILICHKISDELLRKAKKLKWIQLLSAGCDHVLSLPSYRKEIILSTAKNIHHIPISEYVMSYILSLSHRTFDYMKFQKEKKWARIEGMELTGKTLGLIGAGSIGKEIARKAKPFGMHIVALKRTPEQVEFIDEIYGINEMDIVLSRADFIVLALPLIESTKNLIGKKEIEKMKSTAYLINIARGEILDEQALIGALKEKRLAGAVLDVFREEPLGQDSELWNVENLIITPHISWSGEYTFERLSELVLENMARYVNGEQLKYIVERDVGY
ncbi:MAG: D-2-hydroxyacid dehydrogenase [Candidatus Eremiobacterota bacterium]